MFQNCKNIQEVKFLFRRLAMKLHPDYGGENDLMRLLTEHYEQSTHFISSLDEIEKKKRDMKKPKYDKVFEDVMQNDDKLRIIIEIINYGKNHPKFKLDYCYSIREFLENKGFITSSQYNCLLKIYNSFRMFDESEAEMSDAEKAFHDFK